MIIDAPVNNPLNWNNTCYLMIIDNLGVLRVPYNNIMPNLDPSNFNNSGPLYKDPIH